MFDKLNKGTVWDLKGLKNIARRARFYETKTISKFVWAAWPQTHAATP